MGCKENQKALGFTFCASSLLSVCLPSAPLYSLLFGVAYLLEAFSSSTFHYLSQLNAAEDVISYINRVRSSAPEIGFTCECYHYETRSRTACFNEVRFEQQYDAASNSYRSVPVYQPQYYLEHYQEKVVTHAETYRFMYLRWEDCSELLMKDLSKYQAVRINFDASCEFGDQFAEERYSNEKEMFTTKHKGRDTYFSLEEYRTVPGVSEKMLSVVDIKNRSFLLNGFVFTIATLLSLSWLYRMWFERNTAQRSFCFKKRIYG